MIKLLPLSALLTAFLFSFLLSQSLSLAVLLLIVILLAGVIWYLFFQRPWLGLIGLIFSIVPGQLLRLSLGPRGSTAILFIDVVTVLFLSAWLTRKLLKERNITAGALGFPLLASLALALVSLIQGAGVLQDAIGFDLKQFILGGLYWGRLVMYSLVFFAVRDLLHWEAEVKRLWRWLLAASLLVAIAGFIQFVVYPDFTDMAVKYGWDPHLGRLLSTWFDPNFVGGFLAVIALIVLAVLLAQQKWLAKLSLAAIFLVLLYSLVLTYSRSAYVAFAVGLLVLGIWRSRKLLLAMLVLGLLFGLMFPRALERVSEGFNFDATAQKRVVSWQNGLTVLARYPLLGTGYNLIAPVQDEMGLLSEFDINNRAGFENSLLTILVAMGLPGLLVFLWLCLSILGQSFMLANSHYLSSWGRSWSLGVFAGLLGLLVHSLFLNSLLFVLIYLPLMILLAGLDCLHALALEKRKINLGKAKGPQPVHACA